MSTREATKFGTVVGYVLVTTVAAIAVMGAVKIGMVWFG